MFVRLILFFTLVPITELFLLLFVGQRIGITYTLIIILITGLTGVLLAKSQGFAVIRKLREQLSWGQLPGDELIEGLFILVGSLFLLTPGLITDVMGLILLLPFTRRPIREYSKKKIRRALDKGSINLVFRRF